MEFSFHPASDKIYPSQFFHSLFQDSRHLPPMHITYFPHHKVYFLHTLCRFFPLPVLSVSRSRKLSLSSFLLRSVYLLHSLPLHKDSCPFPDSLLKNQYLSLSLPKYHYDKYDSLLLFHLLMYSSLASHCG